MSEINDHAIHEANIDIPHRSLIGLTYWRDTTEVQQQIRTLHRPSFAFCDIESSGLLCLAFGSS
jgi:hypothetical protein